MRKRDLIRQKLKALTDKEILKAMRDTLDDAYETFKRKLGDYGSDAFKAAGGMGILYKINEKFNRMDHLLRVEGPPSCESVRDTISDLSVYAHILISLIDKGLVDMDEIKKDYMATYGKIERMEEIENE